MNHRREFIKSAIRCAGLGLLGSGALVLAGRGGCGRKHPCGECPRYNGCGLDKAVESRKPAIPRNHAG